jgi:SpoVK/Ycf46/Vps4 family AAA+-type ATPase
MLELLNQLDGFEASNQIKVRALPSPRPCPTTRGGSARGLPRLGFRTIPRPFLFPLSLFAQVIMATNRIDILDSALLRPGRIDRKIEFPHPNEGARLDILKIHSRKMNLVRGINLKKIADMMNNASGAPHPPFLCRAGHLCCAWRAFGLPGVCGRCSWLGRRRISPVQWRCPRRDCARGGRAV